MWLFVSVCTCSHLPSWKRSDSLVSASQIQEDQCPRESREFLMTVTYSDCSPWANVALAVVQQSSIAKLGSPRKVKRSLAIGGLSKENITACPAQSGRERQRAPTGRGSQASKCPHTDTGYSKAKRSFLLLQMLSRVRCAIAFPIAPDVQGGMREAGVPTSKQRGRVRRSTGNVVRASVVRGRRMGVVEPGYRVAGWMLEGTIEGCGGGEWDAEGLKRSRLATRAVRVPCTTVGN